MARIDVDNVKTRPFIELLSLNGENSVFQYNSDYSGAETYWEWRPSRGRWTVNQMCIHYGDSGTFDSGSIGNGITLTNGITFSLVKGTGASAEVLYRPFGSYRILNNAAWWHFARSSQLDAYGVGNNYMGVVCDFREFSDGILVDGDLGVALRAILHDNFSGLVHADFIVRGTTSLMVDFP